MKNNIYRCLCCGLSSCVCKPKPCDWALNCYCKGNNGGTPTGGTGTCECDFA